MISFVRKHFQSGFAKGPNATSTPRVRFEAIAVGTALALAKKRTPPGAKRIPDWINEDTFRALTTSDAANNRKRVLERIEFVRDSLLAR